MTETSIEWTQKVWNPVRGCALVSAGCRSCYAMRQAHRFAGRGQAYEGLTRQTPSGPQWNGHVRLVPEALDQPLRWRKPQKVFVNSMSDLFHELVPDQFIDRVFAVMALARQHTFQVLTKRPERMRDYLLGLDKNGPCDRFDAAGVAMGLSDEALCQITNQVNGVLGEGCNVGWPMRNVWLGTSVEDKRAADERIPLLFQTPAAVRFLSCEPLLGMVNLDPALADYYWTCRGCGTTQIPIKDDPACLCAQPDFHREPHIDWVIVGGESGPGARPCDVAWVCSIVEQCKAAGVPAFVKQLGAQAGISGSVRAGGSDFRVVYTRGCGFWPTDVGSEHDWILRMKDRKGGDPSEWPESLRVREFPAEVRS